VIVVQTFNRAGWPVNSTIELEDATAAAVLTAARDFERETGVDLKGDLVAVPAGGLRPVPWIVEMQWAFDHRHSTGADKAKSLALYVHYNMDPDSNARPVLTSPHRYGFCADIADGRFLAWLKSPDPHRPGHNIAARYGLVFTLLKENDLRHAQFFPGTATAALDVTTLDGSAPIPTPQRKDPTMTVVYQMTDAAGAPINDWTRGGLAVLPIGTFPGGYEATADEATARLWIRDAGQETTGPFRSDHDTIVAQQKWWANEYALHQAALGKLIAANAGGGIGATPAQVAAAVQAILNDDFAALAKQEGTDQAALLAAISQVDENTLATFGLKRA